MFGFFIGCSRIIKINNPEFTFMEDKLFPSETRKDFLVGVGGRITP